MISEFEVIKRLLAMKQQCELFSEVGERVSLWTGQPNSLDQAKILAFCIDMYNGSLEGNILKVLVHYEPELSPILGFSEFGRIQFHGFDQLEELVQDIQNGLKEASLEGEWHTICSRIAYLPLVPPDYAFVVITNLLKRFNRELRASNIKLLLLGSNLRILNMETWNRDNEERWVGERKQLDEICTAMKAYRKVQQLAIMEMREDVPANKDN